MANEPLRLESDGGIARLTLNRPEIHNAFDDDLIRRLTETLRTVEADPGVRAVVLASTGKSFSAGADLNWMKRMAGYSDAENRADAMALAEMLRTLNRLAKPTVALVQGAAFGGGVGLVSCCDIAIAATPARFALTEVRLGILPAVISPYVVAAIGERAARRYLLTAERFDAAEALRLGLVHDVVEPEALETAGEALLGELAKAGPLALGETKDLIFRVSRGPVDAAMIEDTAERITRIRASDEGREGIGAFLEKRKPAWLAGTD
ncbi:MAG: enoyl-CoA hydratase/isomerase family protein [Gammaproteobacteria bacterium]|nr:enoyl-CoA hydratase/isomerase family protein [Gammaproteobacteria bacterium]